MVRTVLSLCLALGLGGSVLLAQETKQERSSKQFGKSPTGAVSRYSAKNKSITLEFGSTLMKYKINDDAKVIDAQGEESKEGLKDKRLAAGSRVQLVLEEGGKGVKEIHLMSGSTGRRPRPTRSGEPSTGEKKSKDGKSSDKKGDDKKGDDKKGDDKKGDDKSGGK
jgi:hypothetical protein